MLTLLVPNINVHIQKWYVILKCCYLEKQLGMLPNFPYVLKTIVKQVIYLQIYPWEAYLSYGITEICSK